MLEVLVPTPVPAHIRLPENYTADHSRQFADYPIRVNGTTSYDPKKRSPSSNSYRTPYHKYRLALQQEKRNRT